MEAVIHLDTHVVVWLFAGDTVRLAPVSRTLEASTLVISPMVSLELQYLYEIGRAGVPGVEVVGDLVKRVGLRIADTSLGLVVERAIDLTWTRDPFDRLIVGQALAEGVPLLTRDQTIRDNCAAAVWE